MKIGLANHPPCSQWLNCGDAAQRGRVKGIQGRLWLTRVWPRSTARIESGLVFVEGGKPENPEKNPRSTGENQQTQLTYDTWSGN